MKVLVVAAALAVLAGYLFLVRWRPENQARRCHAGWIESVAAGDHDGFAAPVSDGYGDQWGFSRDDVITAIREASRQFFSLTATWDETGFEAGGDEAALTGTIRLDGRGNLIGQEIVSRVNRETEPFTFVWRRASWKPWDWRLVRISHPRLRVPEGYTPGELGGF